MIYLFYSLLLENLYFDHNTLENHFFLAKGVKIDN